MLIRSRMGISADGFVATPDGLSCRTSIKVGRSAVSAPLTALAKWSALVARVA